MEEAGKPGGNRVKNEGAGPLVLLRDSPALRLGK